jgi:hypothetical protein
MPAAVPHITTSVRVNEFRDVLVRVNDGRLNIAQPMAAVDLWPVQRQKLLIDSVLRGWPIGTIVVWSADFHGSKLVIDGAQRLRTLVNAVMPPAPFGLTADGEIEIGHRDDLFPVDSLIETMRYLPVYNALRDGDSAQQALADRAQDASRTLTGYSIPIIEITGGDRAQAQQIADRLHSR